MPRRTTIRFESREARTALTPTGGYLVGETGGFTHSFNPAIGCAYSGGACGLYCYARGFAERLGGRGTWGRSVILKRNAPDLLERELSRAARRDPKHPLHVRKIRVFASSTTDPCAGPVRDLFRECLRVFARHPLRRVVIQTRSPGVVELRREIEALGPRAVVSLTIESDRAPSLPSLPPGSPSIAARRRALEAMTDWSVRRHVAVAPFLPAGEAAAFAEWIAANATDATVDTFASGDGSGGRRTAAAPIVPLFESSGIDWRDESAARELHDRLREAMPGRVGWSAAGFLRLA